MFPEKPNFLPLSVVERSKLFGTFNFIADPLPDNPENIRIVDGWDIHNIVDVYIPQLRNVSLAPKNCLVQFHIRIAHQLESLFQDWEDAGLLDRVLVWAGSYVPRYQRGSNTKLSNHSFGTAFDINSYWNGLGRTPAPFGTEGSVVELVDLANKNGFYWGGHFNKRPDGMHWEICRIV